MKKLIQLILIIGCTVIHLPTQTLPYCIFNNVSAQQTDQQKRKNDAVLFNVPGADKVIIKKDIPYKETANKSLHMDIYYPPGFDFRNNIPAVLIIFGYTDNAGLKLVGSKMKDYAYYTSWSKKIAASGMASIVYETTQPAKDIIAVYDYLNTNGNKLSIDHKRIGAFSVSAHTPNAVSQVLTKQNNPFRCAAFFYGFFLTQDFDYYTETDSIAKERGFTTPRLSAPESWLKTVPLLIVRSGKDYVPHLNLSMKIFINHAIEHNLPVTFINYDGAPHGFDYLRDSAKTKFIIKNTINFWKYHLKVDEFMETENIIQN